MVVSKKEIFAYLAVSFGAAIAILLIYFTENVWLHVACIWLIAFIAADISGFDLLHPYCWFSIGFALYGTAYTITYLIGHDINGYSSENSLLSAVALTVFLLVMGPKKELKKDSSPLTDVPEISFNIDLLVQILSIVIILFSFLLFFKGYSGKAEMKQANDPFFRIGVYIVRYLCMFTLFQLSRKNRNGEPMKKVIVLGGLACLLFTLFTGERDAFFRYAAVILLFLFVTKHITKRDVLKLIPIAVLLFVFSVYFKYFFSTGNVDTRFTRYGILYAFLRSDFYSAGSNLQYLLNRSWTKGYLGWKLLLTELIYPFVRGRKFVSPSSWFNTAVHTGKYRGYAFTMVGTGYVISGMLGVIVLFAIIAILTKYIYRKSKLNAKWMCGYIYAITTTVFSFRQSLNTITVGFIRIILVSFLILYIANRVKVTVKY